MAGTSAGAKKAAATRRTRKFLAAKHGGYLPGPRSKTRKKTPAKKAAAPAKPRKSKSGYNAWLLKLRELDEAASKPNAHNFTADHAATAHMVKHRGYMHRLRTEMEAMGTRDLGDIIKKVFG